MKLLIITYSYTPDLTPRAFRWSAVAAQLAQMGHDVHVLCAADPGTTAEAEYGGVTVYRVRDWLLNASARVTVGAAMARPAEVPSRGGTLRAALRTSVRFLWRALYWPDYGCGWVIPAAWAARGLCATTSYDWIISVSHPFTGHVVGMLAKAGAPSSKWFVDISDPFHFMREPAPNNWRLYSWLNWIIERRVVANADAISVTTDATRQLYEAKFLLPIGKVSVMPPLLSLPATPEPSVRDDGTPIRLVFVGTLYRKLRSPKFLLNCFSSLASTLPKQRLELHFFGAINDCAKDLPSNPYSDNAVVFVHGLVGRVEVLRAMVDADVLVNIGNDSEAQLASKVIEYMAVGKPILNIVSIARDTSVEVLADYPAALTITRSDDVPSLTVVDALRAFVLNPPSVDSSHIEKVRQRYSLAYVAGLYASTLENGQGNNAPDLFTP